MSMITAENAPSRYDDDSISPTANGVIGSLFEQPSDPILEAGVADLEQDECLELIGGGDEPASMPETAEEGQCDAAVNPQVGAGGTSDSPLSQLAERAESRLRPILDFLKSLRDWCQSHAAPRLDDDEDLSWREALVETVARVVVVARGRHMRALIVLFLLCAGLCSTSGIPVLGPSVDLAVWPLQAVSIVLIWVGLAVPWARGHSFGSMFKDGALIGGESVDVLVPSALLIALGGGSYAVSAMLMGAGSNSWGVFKLMVFFAVSALATATAAHETAAVSRRANQAECNCDI